jgi:hypothetical protein
LSLLSLFNDTSIIGGCIPKSNKRTKR